jgi:DNA-directed RNA polymerase subunit beta'
MKAVQLLVNELLPEDVRDEWTFDKKSMNKLTSTLAAKHPDLYSKVMHQISDIGRHAAYWQGETLTLDDFKPVVDKEKYLAEMRKELSQLRVSAKTQEELNEGRLDIYSKYGDKIKEDSMAAALSNGNNLGNTVVSGARGSPAQLAAMLSTPGLYTDYRDKRLPVFIENSFGEGLRPHEYLTSTFGARKSVIATKTATAQAGDLGKQFVQVASPVVVVEQDCETSQGLDLDISDDSLKGRVLSRDVGNLKAGTVLDRDSISQLRRTGTEKIIARSPMTCKSKGGICTHCLGADPRGKFKPIGYAAGVTAGNAVAEPLAQQGLNTKHTGGIASKKGQRRVFSGYKVLNQFVQAPSAFPDKASLSELDGKVEEIKPAPQGGSIVTIGGEDHYVLPDMDIFVNKGDNVEKGQQISDGVVNITDVVRLRGLGDARRTYAEKLKEILDNSDLHTNSRHTEVLARAAVNHIEIDDDEAFGYLPGDVVQYNEYRHAYTPSDQAKDYNPEAALGKYLEKPVLHYSIGTRITPSVAARLKGVNIDSVSASDREPDFIPRMIRLRTAPAETDSWVQQLSTSYIKSNLQEAAIEGLETDTASSSYYIDTLAKATDFAKDIEETGKF